VTSFLLRQSKRALFSDFVQTFEQKTVKYLSGCSHKPFPAHFYNGDAVKGKVDFEKSIPSRWDIILL